MPKRAYPSHQTRLALLTRRAHTRLYHCHQFPHTGTHHSHHALSLRHYQHCVPLRRHGLLAFWARAVTQDTLGSKHCVTDQDSARLAAAAPRPPVCYCPKTHAYGMPDGRTLCRVRSTALPRAVHLTPPTTPPLPFDMRHPLPQEKDYWVPQRAAVAPRRAGGRPCPELPPLVTLLRITGVPPALPHAVGVPKTTTMPRCRWAICPSQYLPLNTTFTTMQWFFLAHHTCTFIHTHFTRCTHFWVPNIAGFSGLYAPRRCYHRICSSPVAYMTV